MRCLVVGTISIKERPPQGQLQMGQGQLQMEQGQLQMEQGQLQMEQGQLQMEQYFYFSCSNTGLSSTQYVQIPIIFGMALFQC